MDMEYGDITQLSRLDVVNVDSSNAKTETLTVSNTCSLPATTEILDTANRYLTDLQAMYWDIDALKNRSMIVPMTDPTITLMQTEINHLTSDNYTLKESLKELEKKFEEQTERIENGCKFSE